MGHRSIQVTIDVYGHLIPGENVEWIDALDRASEKLKAKDANRTQTRNREEIVTLVSNSKDWLPPRDSNPDMLIQSQLSCR